jgi:hypothetical protein
MHFNFHLSGDESPEQSRRIANAVLALGGLLAPSKSVGEITVDLKLDTSEATAALDKLVAHPTVAAQRPETTRVAECAAIDLAKESDVTTISTVENGKVTSTLVVDEVMTPDEVKAIVNTFEPAPLPPAPPVPTTSNLDAKGLPRAERNPTSNPQLNADGPWRDRKNGPDETKQAVEAELRGLMQAPLYPSTPAQIAAIRAEPVDNYSASVTLPNAEIPPDPSAVRSIHVGNTEVYAAPSVPVPPTPPTPPVPTGALQRTYSDVVNLIMARKVQPDTYVAILGMSLPEFAKHVIGAPNDATLMFDALDAASRP